jgi:hypothetical protein
MKTMWPAAHAHAVLIYTGLPQKGLGWKSPHELIYGTPFEFQHLRVFGCDAYSFVDHTLRDKLDARGEAMVYLGNDPLRLSSFKLLDPAKGKVFKRGMVTFVEDSFRIAHRAGLTALTMLDCDFELTMPPGEVVTSVSAPLVILQAAAHLNPKDQEVYVYFQVQRQGTAQLVWCRAGGFKVLKRKSATVETCARRCLMAFLLLVGRQERPNRMFPLMETCVVRIPGEDSGLPGFLLGIDLDSSVDVNRQVLVCDGTADGDLIDIADTSITLDRTAATASVGQQMIQNGAAKAPEMMLIDAAPCLLLAKTVTVTHGGLEVITEPTSYAQMLTCVDTKEWRLALWVEFDSHRDNDTMTPTSVLPKGYVLLDTKWVFKVKLTSAAFLDKRKARWCIRGDMQQPDTYDPFACYAPTPATFTVKLMLNLCLQLDIEVTHADVPVAFQIPVMSEKVAIRLPLELQIDGCIYAILNKSIYGLKQAASAWRKLSHQFIMNHDSAIRCCRKDVCVYFIWSNSMKMILVNYVDDYAGGCTDSVWWKAFMVAFKAEFNIKDLGPVEQLLGMGIKRTESTLEMCMSKSMI